jgi:signal transduction histidine kinase
MRLIEYLSRKSRVSVTLIGLAVTVYIGEVDYLSGPMVAMLVFYMAPICFVAWFAGRWPGIAVAAVATLIWFAAKNYDSSSILNYGVLVWNTLMRFGVFSALAALTTEVAERKRVEEALRAAHEGLEARVQERTLELGAANQALQAEVAERTLAQANLKHLNETLEQRVAERSAAAEHRAQALARSEAALRQQKNILQSILDSMGDGVIVADAQANILLFNPAAERLMRAGLGRMTPDESAEPYHTYLPGTLTAYPTHEHPLLRAIRGEVFDGAEIFLRDSTRTESLWVSATGRPLIDENKNIQGGVVVFSDISPRRVLEKQIAEISDREQRRIGQDLHDGLCQQLVSTGFAVELLREKLDQRKLREVAEAEAIAEMINSGISQARRLARGLYPVRLEVDGLASALEELAAMMQARHNIACRFACDEPVLIYDEVAGNNLYRIAQEAINNAVKHSACQGISVGLGAVEDEVTLTIKDDGAGFSETTDPSSGMGLHIMNYRAKMIGAALDIRRGVGGGTIVICSFHNERVATQEELVAAAK